MNPATDWIDQARQLFDALRGSLGETATPPEDGAAPEHSADCRWCPICQFAAVVRGERPEVTAALADVLTATATALRTFAAAAEGAAAPAEETADDGREEDDPPPAVQRIEIA
ncbi:MAG: uncharacterized protein JWR45_247 [Blastococcus sp.]|jgi:hypothetical protein|nr:uncharacterized protein [Blastococcus sp.]